MDWKLYWVLMPLFFVAGIVLLAVLPSSNRPYILLFTPLGFWLVYYLWKKKK